MSHLSGEIHISALNVPNLQSCHTNDECLHFLKGVLLASVKKSYEADRIDISMDRMDKLVELIELIHRLSIRSIDFFEAAELHTIRLPEFQAYNDRIKKPDGVGSASIPKSEAHHAQNPSSSKSSNQNEVINNYVKYIRARACGDSKSAINSDVSLYRNALYFHVIYIKF